MKQLPAPRYVGFWSRLAAFFIDSILLFLIIGPVLMAIYGPEYWQDETVLTGFWDFVVSWIFPAVIVVAFWLYRSATPGKMFIHARIIDAETGGKPEISQWLVRYLGYYVSFLPLGIGCLWVMFDRRKQAWHDKLAGTVVVRDTRSNLKHADETVSR